MVYSMVLLFLIMKGKNMFEFIKNLFNRNNEKEEEKEDTTRYRIIAAPHAHPDNKFVLIDNISSEKVIFYDFYLDGMYRSHLTDEVYYVKSEVRPDGLDETNIITNREAQQVVYDPKYRREDY